MEVDILTEALDLAPAKNRPCCHIRPSKRYPVKTVTTTLGVVRSNVIEPRDD